MGDITKLDVWQDGRILANMVYTMTNSGGISRDYGLKDQLRRSAVSIVSNIAEGEESGFEKKAIHHFYISKGSIAELQTQIIIAKDNNLINNHEADKTLGAITTLSKKMRKLIQYRENNL